MKRLLFPILFGIVLFTDSCLKVDKTETNPQAAITSFTLGYFNVRFHDVNYLGNDTIVYTRQGGAMYPMTIDQMNNRIYNIDSLAYGAVLNSVTCNISSVGTVLYRYPDLDEGVAYVWNYGDSLDFTRKLQFIVVSTDETYTRAYDFQLNVRTVFPDSLIWTNADSIGYSPLRDQCSVFALDSLFNFGYDDNGILSMVCKKAVNGEWKVPQAISGFDAAGWKKAVTAYNDTLYTVSGSVLYCSANGVEWQTAADGISSIMPSDGNGWLYAVSNDGKLLKSQGKSSWSQVEAIPEGFPDSIAKVFTYPSVTNPALDRVIFTGISNDDGIVRTWTIFPNDSVLTRYDSPQDSSLLLPALGSLSVIRYDGKLYAFGAGFDGFRESSDNGLTWFFCDRYAYDYSSWNQYMQLPAALKGLDCGFSYATDNLGNIWIMTEDGQVWRGAINRLRKRLE